MTTQTRLMIFGGAMLVAAAGGCAQNKLKAQRDALLKQNRQMQMQLKEAQAQASDAQAAQQQPPPPTAPAPMATTGSTGGSQFLPLQEKLPKSKQGRNGKRHFSWKRYHGGKTTHKVARHYRGLKVVHHGRQTRLILASDIVFPSASARILPRARRVLLHVAYLIHHHYYHRRIKVEGFTDKRPIHHPYKNNYALGLARARAVMHFLAMHGVRSANMRAISFGAGRPVSRTDMARNRRVEIVVQ